MRALFLIIMRSKDKSLLRHALPRVLAFIGMLTLMPTLAAAQTEIENGVPVTIAVDAEMDNNFSVLVTDINFGTLGATNGSGTAKLTVTVDGDINTQTSGPMARIVAKGNGVTPGILEISSALSHQALHIRYSNVQNLTCLSCPGSPPPLEILEIFDNASAQAGRWSATDPAPDANATNGIVTTNNNGEASLRIGVTIGTNNAMQPYPTGVYSGTFDITLEY